MQTFRSLISFGLWIIFLLLLITIVVFSNPLAFEGSFKNSQKIQADFELIGDYTQSYLLETGRLPTNTELSDWGRDKKFRTATYEGDNVVESNIGLMLVEGADGCGELTQNVKRTYSLCYWRGEWTEEYSPQTKETTLPSKISDYYVKWYYWLVIILLAGLAYIISPREKKEDS